MTQASFDFEVETVEVERKRTVARARAPRPPKPEPLSPELDPPKPAPEWRWQQQAALNRIEDVSARVRSSHMNQHVGEFRLDAVAQTAVLMFEQQLCFTAGEPPGRVLHEALDDETLAATWRWCQAMLTWIHPFIFPAWPEWSVADLRRWIGLWWGVDMIGAQGRLHVDVVALTFQLAGSMSGKQKAWGAFYTPYEVCRLMVDMTMHGDDEPWQRSMMEPSVGAGSIVVAMFDHVRQALMDAQRAGRVHPSEVPGLMRGWVRRVHAVDIDREAVWTTAVNLAVRSGYTCRVEHPYREAALQEPVTA